MFETYPDIFNYCRDSLCLGDVKGVAIKTAGNVLRNLRETLEKNWRGEAKESQRVLMTIMNTALKEEEEKNQCNARKKDINLIHCIMIVLLLGPNISEIGEKVKVKVCTW